MKAIHAWTLLLGLTLAAAGASAQEPEPEYPTTEPAPPPVDEPLEAMPPPDEPPPRTAVPPPVEPAPYDEPAPTTMPAHIRSGIGMSLSVGGGVTDFTDEDARDMVDPGGSWDARVAAGTRRLIAGEIAYIGSARNLDTLGVEDDATLVSNGIEGLLRLNFGVAAFQPFVFAGAAWKHYEVTNTDVNTSDVANDDDVLEIPLGAGIGYRFGGFLVDVRGSFRPATADDLMDAAGSSPLHSYDIGGKLGWEF